MSDDLISRKETLSVLEKVFHEYKISFGNNYGGFAQAVPESIKSISTAYDVDKVVERLEVNSTFEPEDNELYINLDDAVKIVKSGGIGIRYCPFCGEETIIVCTDGTVLCDSCEKRFSAEAL